MLPAPSLRFILYTLSGLAFAFCIQVASIPRWPKAETPPAKTTILSDWKLTLTGSSPPQRRADWALGSTHRYTISNQNPSQSSLSEVLLTAVVVRRLDGFEVARLTNDLPQLRIENRLIRMPERDVEVALGSIGGKDALQTCVLPHGASGVTKATLQRLSFQRVQGESRLLRWLGRLTGITTDVHYRCNLLTIIQPHAGASEQLLLLWGQLRKASLLTVSSEETL